MACLHRRRPRGTTTATATGTADISNKRYTSSITTSIYSSLSILLLTLFACCQHVSSLRILLTNDDGLDRPGLQTLRTALINDGHEVYVYAPNADKTGLGANIQLNLDYTEIGERQTVVQGPPASCVIAGLSLLNQTDMGLPEMVIVGISDGFASGPQTLHSGSIGAAITALQRNFPTLAVAGVPTVPGVSVQDYFTNVADFTVRFINRWMEEIPLSRMPEGYGLKIGYPALLPQDITGIDIAEDGIYSPISLGYVPSEGNPNLYQVSPVETTMEYDDDSEFALNEQGYISVLPISSRFSLPRSDYNVRFILTLRRMIRGLEVEQA